LLTLSLRAGEINLEIRSEADCNYHTLGLGVSTVGARNLLRIESNVKKTNCLIKKVLERVFVASNNGSQKAKGSGDGSNLAQETFIQLLPKGAAWSESAFTAHFA
jgi:hypothetical protein